MESTPLNKTSLVGLTFIYKNHQAHFIYHTNATFTRASTRAIKYDKPVGTKIENIMRTSGLSMS